MFATLCRQQLRRSRHPLEAGLLTASEQAVKRDSRGNFAGFIRIHLAKC